MSSEKHTSKRSQFGTAPRPLRDFSGGAPTPKKRRKGRESPSALMGLVSVTTVQAFLLWLAVSVLRSAEAVSFGIGWWHCMALSALFLVWRTLYSYVFHHMDSLNKVDK